MNDGGPAFARAPFYAPDLGEWTSQQNGMSLRDYFAAKAMQAVLSDARMWQGVVESATRTSERRDDYVAEMAYEFADAMLRARE